MEAELPPDWGKDVWHWPGGYGSSEIRKEKNQDVVRRYKEKLVKKGWLTMSWPAEYGGQEYTYMEQAIFDERTSYYLAPNMDVIAAGRAGHSEPE